MVRGLWLLAAAVAGLSVAFLLFPQAPAWIDALMAAALGKPPATPYSAPYIAFAAAVSIGLFVFFLATVVAAAVLESLNLATATTQTAALIRQQKKGEPVYAHDFLATTDVESVKPFAEQYAQDIHLEPAATLPGAAPAAKPGGKVQPPSQPKPVAGRYVSERPAQTVFLTRAFLERPLFLDMLRPLPSIFFGLSAFGLLIGLVDGLARARLPLDNPGDGFSRGFEAGLVAATLPLLLGVLCWFLSELIVSRRIRLAQQFCRLLDQLFPPVTANHYIRQLAAWAARATGQGGTTPDGATDALVAGIGAELTRQFGRLEMSLEAQEKNRGDSLKKAIEDGLKKPLGQLTDTATRLAGDQTGQVEKLLDKTLAAFAKQLKQILGGDLEGLAKVLTETAERLKTITDKLAATPVAAAADGEAAGPIAGEVQAALTELTGTVTEALAKLDATQARLIATLEDERAAGTAIAAAARDLEAVTQANRDTVERFVDLAGELTKLSSQTAAQPAAAASKTGAGGEAQPKRAANDIIRALEELRAESEEAAKSLPKI